MYIHVDDGCEKFAITNVTDNNRTFVLTRFPNNTSSVADLYEEAKKQYEDDFSVYSGYKEISDKLLDFINEYRIYPEDVGEADTNNNGSINRPWYYIVDRVMGYSNSQLETEINSYKLIMANSENKVCDNFKPVTTSASLDNHKHTTSCPYPGQHDDMRIDANSGYFLVETGQKPGKYHENVHINSDILTKLKNDNGLYNYNDYNLIPLYNDIYDYLADEYEPTQKADSNLAYYYLLIAIRDYRAAMIPTNDWKKISDDSYDKYMIYSNAGNPDVDGDELEVFVDNKTQIMTCNKDINIYEYFGDEYGNHHFLRLLKGDNTLKFEGSGTVTIECEFLRKVGI